MLWNCKVLYTPSSTTLLREMLGCVLRYLESRAEPGLEGDLQPWLSGEEGHGFSQLGGCPCVSNRGCQAQDL